MAELTKIYQSDDIQKELEDIYKQYHNSIKVFIGQLEVLQNKFPVEILNEVRAVFSHIAKVYVCNDKKIAEVNICKAKNHIKRAQLDSFKYMCYQRYGLVTKLCLTLEPPWTVARLLFPWIQARILEWVATSSSRESS